MAVIVLADDDDLVRQSLAMVLRDAGHVVHEAGHGAAAADAIETFSPGLVITDVFMPGTDGIELLQHIQETRPDLPVLAISGGGMQQDPKFSSGLAIASGAKQSLSKPIDNDVLLAEVSRLARG